MTSNGKYERGIGDNSTSELLPRADTLTGLIPEHAGRYEGMLQQAVRFLDRLSSYARLASNDVEQAVNGKNVVVRTNSAVSANEHLQKLEKETEDWFAVLQTMKKGKDVHIEENCKGSKLEIVAGAEYEFGQYIIDQSDGKYCEDYPSEVRGNRAGKAYIEKVNAQKEESNDSNQ